MDLSGDPELGDEIEPTPGADYRCLREFEIIPSELLEEVEAEIFTREATLVDLLLYASTDTELVAEAYSTSECLRLANIRLRRCKAETSSLAKWLEAPEVSKVVIEGECVEIVVPADNPMRVKNFLEKVGLKPREVLAYRWRE